MRQGCILSPTLFNIYSEPISKNALDGFTGDIEVGGKMITNFMYADGLVLIAGSIKELRESIDKS